MLLVLLTDVYQSELSLYEFAILYGILPRRNQHNFYTCIDKPALGQDEQNKEKKKYKDASIRFWFWNLSMLNFVQNLGSVY